MKRYGRKYAGVLLSLLMLAWMTACAPVQEKKSRIPSEIASLEVEVVAIPGASVSAIPNNAVSVIPEGAVTVTPDISGTTSSTETSTTAETSTAAEPSTTAEQDWLVEIPQEGNYYYDLQNVVLYLYLYDELPDNYLTKSEARKLGWEGGSVEKYKEGAAIGGDSFGNREGLLPKEKGRTYTECDIDTDGEKSRGAKRLVFSNDGLYFYTEDHYESFDEVTVSERYEVIW